MIYSALVNPSFPQFVIMDGISDHLAVFLTITFPVKNSCRVKCSKIRKLCMIKKTEFMSDIANSELIQAPYKTVSLLPHQYFHTLRNLLDKHAPIHEHKTPQHLNKGFINSEIFAVKGVAKGQLCHKSQQI